MLLDVPSNELIDDPSHRFNDLAVRSIAPINNAIGTSSSREIYSVVSAETIECGPSEISAGKSHNLGRRDNCEVYNGPSKVYIGKICCIESAGNALLRPRPSQNGAGQVGAGQVGTP